MTRLVQPPVELEIELDAERTPIRMHRPVVGLLEAVAHWRVEMEWWREPVLRDYWRVIVNGTVICEIFQTAGQETWYLDRVLD
jgi:hypothetical protein